MEQTVARVRIQDLRLISSEQDGRLHSEPLCSAFGSVDVVKMTGWEGWLLQEPS